MDIHRCRFVEYPASAINAIAFSHPHLSTSSKSNKYVPVRLAIGRANGDIEIWNPLNGAWHHEITIAGGKDRSVDGLVWINGDDEQLDNGKTLYGRSRLFSIGYTTAVTEWDLENARAKRHASGQHGEIWCLGAQPRAASGPAGQKLVGGTVDGCLVIYSTEDDDLRFQRFTRASKKNARMVCVAFQSRQIAVVGCSDSTIRVFNVNKGNLLKTMTLGRDLAGGSKDIIVWSIKALPNGDIVSGDSTGQIRIWDGKTFTQAQRIQAHTQDVLSLASSADGTTIVSGGMDRRTVFLREMSGKASPWTKVWHRRYHNHDVKAMASFETKGMSVVVSGGPDASPIVLPLRKSGSEHHRTLSHLPQTAPLCSASKARMMISWWGREVNIWRLDKGFQEMLDGDHRAPTIDHNRKLIGRILIKGDFNITSASLSQDGSLLVVCTGSDTKAFHLKQLPSARKELKITKLTIPTLVASQGAIRVSVSPDGLWVCLAQPGGRIALVKVTEDSSNPGFQLTEDSPFFGLSRLRRNIPAHVRLGGLGSYDRQVTNIAWSPDSKVLAVADLAGYIDTWRLRATLDALQNGTRSDDEEKDDASSSSSSSDDESEDEKDAVKTRHGWIRNPNARLVPKLPAAATVLSFSPDMWNATHISGGSAEDYVLLAITTTSELMSFHPLQGKLTPWYYRIKPTNLPVEYRNIRDLAKGIFWQGPRLFIYGAAFLCMIDTSMEPDRKQAAALVSLGQAQGLKRKRGADTGAGTKMEVGALGPYSIKKDVRKEGNSELLDITMQDADDGPDSGAESDASDEIEPEQRRQDEEAVITVANTNGEMVAEPKRWWCTFKFRNILGIVPLESPESDSGSERNGIDVYSPIEVALVERPTRDLDLPVRYVGDDE